MFRTMRRSRQLLSPEKTLAVMGRCTNGVLACWGDEDYPYAVPVSYAFVEGTIYLHSARSGHKIDAIARNPKVSFAVVDEDTIVGAEYTSYFRSAIAFGRARIAEGEERQAALAALVEKYSADQPEDDKQRVIGECERACVIAIDVEHLTGKEAIELVQARRDQEPRG